MSPSVRQGGPCDWSCCFFASRSRAKSAASHSNTHANKRKLKTGYSWRASVMHPRASRRMKCQISSLTVRSGHLLNLAFNLVSAASAQQPQSTYRMTGGDPHLPAGIAWPDRQPSCPGQLHCTLHTYQYLTILISLGGEPECCALGSSDKLSLFSEAKKIV